MDRQSIIGESDSLPAVQHLDAFYRFTRPHTMLGTFLSVCSVSIMAMNGESWTMQATLALASALGAALLANVSIVGLNQCYDVDIDRVNKPYLPLASGEFSLQTGWSIVCASGAAALLGAWLSGSVPLLVTVGASIALGVVYSVDLPLFRWKRFPVAAAGCILAVRAVLVQLGFWAHMRLATSPGPLEVPSSVAFMVGFMTWFSVVIALFKDIPDVRGDARADVRTASVRFGVRRIFWACIALLQAAYASALWYIWTHCGGALRVAALAGQAALAALLAHKAAATDLNRHEHIVDAYMFVWKLFYAQYLLVPLLA